MLALALTFLTGLAHAQACVCSRNVALPSGNVARAWAGIFTLDYSASLHNDPDSWEGFAVTDRYGDSMAGMYMPPMLDHTGSLTAALGLPAHFSVSTTVPYTYMDYLGVSDMPGEVDTDAFADVDLTGKWGHMDKARNSFYGFSAGLTLPTGKVVQYSPVRMGRGVFGASFGANAGAKVSPKLGIAAQISGSTGFGADPTGYRVAPSGSILAGVRWSPRENGKLNLALFAMERWSGQDMQDALVYKNSGFLTTDLALAASYTFWEKALRSANLTLRGQAPVFQVIGDPMYAENFGADVAVSVVAF